VQEEQIVTGLFTFVESYDECCVPGEGMVTLTSGAIYIQGVSKRALQL
jgi:hypothetical protein